MYLNKVLIAGNLTRQPELKKTPAGISVTNLSIAVNNTYKNSQGERVEETEFISVSVFRQTADLCAQYLVKGQSVFVEGKIKNRTVEKEGSKTYHTGIVADRVQFGSKPSQNGGGTTKSNGEHENTSRGTTDSGGGRQGPVPMDESIEYPENENMGEIPF